MALSDFTPESREIPLPNGKSFLVYGLSLEQIAVLVRTHLPDLEAVYDVIQHSEKINAQSLQDIAVSIISQAPGLAANIIALGAREPTSAPTAAQLPIAIQLDALIETFELTFTEVGSVKKLLGLITSLGMQEKAKSMLSTLTKAM